MSSLREDAASIFRAGVAAADPYQAVRRALSFSAGKLEIGLTGQSLRVISVNRIHLIAFGKAAVAMAQATRDALPDLLLTENGIVITNYENSRSIAGLRVMGSGHPIPDAAGLEAAQLIEQTLTYAAADELVLVLVSGGGSALLPYPVDGVNLADKIATTQLLLGCGATINQINCVRKHLSRIKGGGLAKMAAPAKLHALILSDVLGDDVSAIASGPTVADETTFSDAIAILQAHRIWQQTPATVQAYLQQGAASLRPETIKPFDPLLQNTGFTVIGSNAVSLEAAELTARHLGYHTAIYDRQLTGEARDGATHFAQYARQLAQHITRPTALLAGGETTVTLQGNGKGGRNQEMALAFALAAERIGLSGAWVFLSAGTDGRDGPTDAAGGMVDNSSLQRMRNAAIDPQAMLQDNDSHPALKAADDLLVCGATGTNVADLQILLLQPDA